MLVLQRRRLRLREFDQPRATPLSEKGCAGHEPQAVGSAGGLITQPLRSAAWIQSCLLQFVQLWVSYFTSLILCVLICGFEASI